MTTCSRPTRPGSRPGSRRASSTLADGDTYDLHIAPIANTVGDQTVRMIPYNGSVPGPTLRVRQGSEIVVRVRNDGDTETTVHWHGLRVDNRSTASRTRRRPPIPIGGTFNYRLRFPDDGLYWYHPHVREDYGIEMGQYGTILVDPVDDAAGLRSITRSVATLDDLLIEDGQIASFSTDGADAHGDGPLRERDAHLRPRRPAPRCAHRRHRPVLHREHREHSDLQRVDPRCRHEARRRGQRPLRARGVHRFRAARPLGASRRRRPLPDRRRVPDRAQHPDHPYRLGAITVTDGPVGASGAEEFSTLHRNDALAPERERFEDDLNRPPDKTLVLDAEMPLLYGEAAEPAAALWTCPMHPDVVSTEQGTCPQCGMKLVAAAPAPGRARCTRTS